MNRFWIALVGLSLLSPASASAQFKIVGRKGLDQLNAQLQGQVVDHTNNHGTDKRIYSCALQEKRDLYVYLPPGFDPAKRYPLLLWLHGFAQDEVAFIREEIPGIDRAMADGKLAPMIIAVPDGTLLGRPRVFLPGSFFLNTKAGRYEDYLMIDVWDFLMKHYPLRPEREAHAIGGISMGGNAAFNKAIKYRERFGTVFGIFPPLNVRWLDCNGRYMAPFDPDCWGWRTNFQHRWEVVARFYGVLVFRQGQVVFPLYGRGHNEETLAAVSRENPIEMLDTYDVREGQLAMYIAYGGKDEFNINTQIDSFLYRARERGLKICVDFDPNGHHTGATANKLFPAILDWLGAQMAPYHN
jgi:pimeloyl-ACP methyl ester carboxylesterase